MFTDGRSKKVVFIAHCILNQNSISDGTAVFPAAFKEVIKKFLDADIGIVQMPCPELCCLGLNRGNDNGADVPVVIENTRIRKEMQKGETHKLLMVQVDYVMKQITEYNGDQEDVRVLCEAETDLISFSGQEGEPSEPLRIKTEINKKKQKR